MAVIYIVEDDKALQGELAKLLELNDYEVAICSDFANAAQEVLESAPDLVILDLNLPGISGHSICRDIRQGRLRELGSQEGPHDGRGIVGKPSGPDAKDVPIMILTSSDDEFTEVMSLSLGAHDFIAKPYRPAVLLARISSLIKHHNQAPSNSAIIEYGGVLLDTAASEVEHAGERATLTRNEQRILALLMKNPDTIISRQEIMCDLWESDAFIDDNTLTVNVNRLRKTLASIGVPVDFLQTRRALGYIVTSSGSK